MSGCGNSKASRFVLAGVRGALARASVGSINGVPSGPSRPGRGRKREGAQLLMLATFGLAFVGPLVAPPAHATRCVSCYGGPIFDPNGGVPFMGGIGDEVWLTDTGLSFYAAGWFDPIPRVAAPPVAHHFSSGFIGADDISAPSAYASNPYAQSDLSPTTWHFTQPNVMEDDGTFEETSLSDFEKTWSSWSQANQSVSVTFDDSSGSDDSSTLINTDVLNQEMWLNTDSLDDSSAEYNPNADDATEAPASDLPQATAQAPQLPLDTADAEASSTDYGSGDSSNVQDETAGEPINWMTGDVVQVQRDYTAFGPFPLRFVRFYHSVTLVSNFATTELGTGWRGSYDSSVQQVFGQSVPTAVLVRPDGQSLLFTNSSGGNQWTASDPTVRAVLVSQTDGSGNITGWTYTTANDYTETYSATGQLLSIANRAGLTQNLSYNGNGQLTGVTDPYGHQLRFTYDVQGQLVELTDPMGGHYEYSYDGNDNLISITYPDNTTRQYLYEDSAFPHAMTGIVDENGSRFVTWTYDSEGRATSSVLAGGVQPVSITYNADGSSFVTDARGTTRRHTFMTTATGALRPVSDTVQSCLASCPALSTSLTYDANGFAESGVDENGNVTAFTYDSRGLMTSRTEAADTPLARTVNITWSPTFHLPTEIAFPGRIIDYAYDNQGDRTSKTVTADGVTRTWKYTYNVQGLLTQLIGPRTDVAQITSFTYDNQGHLTSIKDALGHLTQFTAYDASGRLLSMIDENGVVESFTYDARGRLMSRTVAGRTLGVQRDAVGQITKVNYPNGSSVTLTYDAAHRLTDATDSLGIDRHRVLDAAGDVTQIELIDTNKAVVHETSYAADGFGRITGVTDANGDTSTIGYDTDGHPTSDTDALGRVSHISYDALNRPVSFTDPAGGVTAIEFNAFDEPTEVTAPNGAVTQYSYNDFQQLISEASPDRGTTTIGYSPAGLPITRTDARGITASLTYDALNRVTQLTYTGPASPVTPSAWLQQLGSSVLSDNVSFTYDQGPGCTFGIGRLCARTDQSGTESYAYDTFGDITQQTDSLLGQSYRTQYSYDSGNQLIGMTYPDGRIVSYTRDALERITSVQSTVNGVVSPVLSGVEYRADGAPTNQTFGNGLVETRGYDPVGRLVSQVIGRADTRSYGFNAVGDMTSKMTDTESDQFTYDVLDRLSGEQRTQGLNSFGNSFDYDPNGNRLSENRNGTTIPLAYTPDSNRLIQVGASPITLDAAGDTTSDSGGLRQFYYSPAGHLQWVSNLGLPIAGYLYNGLGQRTGKLTLAGITLYHYDIFGRLISETSIGSQPSRDYVWAGGIPVAQIDHWVPLGNMLTLAHCSLGLDGKIDWITYLHTDGSGTVRLGTDLSQNVVWRDDGEAFGETAPNQETPLGAYPVMVNLRSPGQYFDAETGLFYNGARYYDPQLGRYIESDPIGVLGGLNTYAYGYDSPLTSIDPLGMWGLSVVQAGHWIEMATTIVLGAAAAPAEVPLGLALAAVAGAYALGEAIGEGINYLTEDSSTSSPPMAPPSSPPPLPTNACSS